MAYDLGIALGDAGPGEGKVLFREHEPKALVELSRVRDVARRVREQFDAGTEPIDILGNVEILEAAYRTLEEALPTGVNSGNLARHIHFLGYYLKQDRPEACRDDIHDVCRVDLPKLEKAIQAHAGHELDYDAEFAEKVGPLLRDQHWDSAVRKGFVILKERLVKQLGLAPELDGNDLVNAAFGGKGVLAGRLPDSERQAMRDLLAGLYGVFRNRYGHRDVAPGWFEAAAVLSMIDWALKTIDGYASALSLDSTS